MHAERGMVRIVRCGTCLWRETPNTNTLTYYAQTADLVWLAWRYRYQRNIASRNPGMGARRSTLRSYAYVIRREGASGLELRPAAWAKLAVQGIVLRENGYRCEEGIVRSEEHTSELQSPCNL